MARYWRQELQLRNAAETIASVSCRDCSNRICPRSKAGNIRSREEYVIRTGSRTLVTEAWRLRAMMMLSVNRRTALESICQQSDATPHHITPTPQRDREGVRER
jgi:hypothetical protein